MLSIRFYEVCESFSICHFSRKIINYKGVVDTASLVPLDFYYTEKKRNGAKKARRQQNVESLLLITSIAPEKSIVS